METMQRAFAFGQPEVATAYFANSARLLGEIADVLGHKEDCLHYRELAKKRVWHIRVSASKMVISHPRGSVSM